MQKVEVESLRPFPRNARCRAKKRASGAPPRTALREGFVLIVATQWPERPGPSSSAARGRAFRTLTKTTLAAARERALGYARRGGRGRRPARSGRHSVAVPLRRAVR